MNAILLSLSLFAAPASHPFTARDMQSMDRVSDVQLSPDGKLLVFTVTSTDLEANKRTASLWLLRTEGGSSPTRLTDYPGVKDGNPRWAPDSKTVYFLSPRSGTSQVWRIDVSGGEAQKVTEEPLDVGNLALSPDGKTLAYSMAAFPDCPDAACTKAKLDELAKKKPSGKLFSSLMVRHWDTWGDGTRSHLFVRPAAASPETPSRDPTRALDADVPSQPFGGPEEWAFTPDSTSIVFTAKLAKEEAWSTNYDLYRVPIDGSAPPKDLTAFNLAADSQPRFSPDGHTLAWLAQVRPGFESDRVRVMLQSWPDGRPRSLTEEWDRSPEDLAWSKDGRTLFATADHLGNHALFSIDAATGKANPIVSDGTVRSPIGVGGHQLFFGWESFKNPTEVFGARLDGTKKTALTRFNAARLEATRMGEVEPLSFTGAHGDMVHGWVVQPVDREPGRKYPVALLIHGGPQGSWNNDFHYRWNPEAFAGAGYAVVMVDFHGSTGYGQAFLDAIRDDWGGAPLEDLQKGLAAALKEHPWMEGNQACALGGSYGGWMIDWIEGAWPDRFRCLVSHDGIFDNRSMYFDTEELWFPEWELKGTPWETPAEYEKHNPLEKVAAWKTPILFVHGANDFRVPLSQGLAGFTAAQRRAIPSELLYFPDENHWVLKPQNSVQWYDTVIGWLDRWTKKTTAAAAP